MLAKKILNKHVIKTIAVLTLFLLNILIGCGPVVEKEQGNNTIEEGNGITVGGPRSMAIQSDGTVWASSTSNYG